MRFETVFTGMRIPDSFGQLFSLNVYAEQWRFKEEIVYLVLTYQSFNTRPEQQNLYLKINIPLRCFDDNLLNVKDYHCVDNVNFHFELKDNSLYCTTFDKVFLTSLVFAAYDKDADAMRNSYKRGKIDYGEIYGVLKDPLDKVCGLVTKDDIQFPSAKEYFPLEKGDYIVNKLDIDMHRYQTRFSVNVTPQKAEHYISAVLLTKGENEYLDEFLELNHKAGIDYFYIYDNNDEKDRIDLSNTKWKDLCTIIPFKKKRQLQYEAYDHFLTNYKYETSWATFIDTDEIYTGDLKQVCKENENYVCLTTFWTCHNANGLVKKPEGRQFDNYTKIVPYGYNYPLGKCIIQPDKVDKMYVHECNISRCYDKVYFGEETNPSEEYIPPSAEITLHHFITRSLEEWVDKVYRGSCDPFYVRRVKEFLHYNPEMENEFYAYLKEREIPIDFKQVG